MVLKVLCTKILFIKLNNSSKHSLMLAKPVSRCIQCTSFCRQNRFLFFSNELAQSTTLGPKLKFWMVLCHFVAAPDPLRKLVSRCIQSTSLCLGNHFLFGRDEHAQSITLGLKLLLDTSMHFYIAFDNS